MYKTKDCEGWCINIDIPAFLLCTCENVYSFMQCIMYIHYVYQYCIFTNYISVMYITIEYPRYPQGRVYNKWG